MSHALDAMLDWHTVTVRRFLGEGSNGPRYSAPITLPCTLNEQTTVTVSAAGNVTGTTATLVYRVEHADKINPGALVTLPSGREAEVVSAQLATGGGPVTGLDTGVAVLS